jgi:Kef-type K+ transport system membrane component KefB
MDIAAAISLSNLELTRFFIALVLLLLTAHFLGFLFYELKLPRVVGEILGGLLLGPTALGYLSPDAQNWIFGAFPSEGKLISLISNFGLILLMLVSGFEIQRSFSRQDRKIATAFLLGATLVPFIVGLLTPQLVNLAAYSGPNGNGLSLAIIVGIGVSVTSIPVISKIFIDLKIINTRFAKIVLTIATIEDVIQFAALAIATGVGGSSVVTLNLVAATVLATAVFFVLALVALPRLILYTYRSRFDFLIKTHPSRYALFLCFLLVALASLLNVNVVFGAFLAGVALATLPEESFAKAKSQIKAISFATFTPVYFAVVGLKLDLVHQFDPVFFLAFLLFSTALKGVGALGVGRIVRQSWKSSVNFAVALNARGGPGIVLATVAFDLGLISETFFVALVLVAIVTSLVAGYWLRYVKGKGGEFLQNHITAGEQ